MRRRQVVTALHDAAAVISVSRALGYKATELGVPAERLHVIYNGVDAALFRPGDRADARGALGLPSSGRVVLRSEEHTSELQSLMRISYAVFCLKKKRNTT